MLVSGCMTYGIVPILVNAALPGYTSAFKHTLLDINGPPGVFPGPSRDKVGLAMLPASGWTVENWTEGCWEEDLCEHKKCSLLLELERAHSARQAHMNGLVRGQ